jgi:peptidylprolyl isomerase
MEKAKSGDVVSVDYTGTLAGGEVFDSSEGREPLKFTVGSGQVIPGFEQAVAGMEPGEAKKVEIPPEQAYGLHNPDMLLRVERGNIPAELELKVGLSIVGRDDQNNETRFTVAEFSDESVTLDANHPLAGKDLTFDIKLVEIAPAVA